MKEVDCKYAYKEVFYEFQCPYCENDNELNEEEISEIEVCEYCGKEVKLNKIKEY